MRVQAFSQLRYRVLESLYRRARGRVWWRTRVRDEARAGMTHNSNRQQCCALLRGLSRGCVAGCGPGQLVVFQDPSPSVPS